MYAFYKHVNHIYLKITYVTKSFLYLIFAVLIAQSILVMGHWLLSVSTDCI